MSIDPVRRHNGSDVESVGQPVDSQPLPETLATKPIHGIGDIHAPSPINKEYISLDEAERREFLKQAEIACEEFNRIDEKDLSTRAGVLRKHFTMMPLYVQSDAFKKLIDQLVIDTERDGLYDETRALVDEQIAKGSNMLLGVFQVPYFVGLKKPSLAALTFESRGINTIPRLYRDYKSNARALQNTKGTSLWELDRLGKVAIFPEFWPSKEKDNPNSHAYYLVDRFVERIDNFTLPALKSSIDPNSFTLVRQNIRNKDALRKAVFVWLSTHEHNHSQGLLPRVFRGSISGVKSDLIIDNQLQKNAEFGYELKDTRETGAFEEMRVDVKSLVKLFGETLSNNESTAPLAREAILLERLVRYPLQKHPNENFDSITSHMLLNYLFEKEAVRFKDGRLVLDNYTAKKALESFEQEFDNLEEEISRKYKLDEPRDPDAPDKPSEAMLQARAEVQKFVRKWACRHEKGLQAKIDDGSFDYKKDYPMHPFYTFAKSIKSKDDRQTWDIALRKLLKNDLTVYGEQALTWDNESFVKYIRALKDNGLPRQLGDDFLVLLAAGDLDKIEDWDTKLIYLAGKSRSEKEERELNAVIQEEIPKIIMRHGEKFEIKAFDERFLSRVKRLLEYKISVCRSHVFDPRIDTNTIKGQVLFEKLSMEGAKNLQVWRRGKLGQRLVKPAALSLAALATVLSVCFINPVSSKPELDLDDKGASHIKKAGPEKKDVKFVPSELHEPKPPLIPQIINANVEHKISNFPLLPFASISKNGKGELIVDDKFSSPPRVNLNKQQDKKIKEFLNAITLRALKELEEKELIQFPCEIGYSSPAFPVIGVEILGLPSNKQIRVNLETIKELINDDRINPKVLAESIPLTINNIK